MTAQRPRVTVSAVEDPLPFKQPFSITGYTFTAWPVVIARLETGGVAGEGEASGVYYRNEDPAAMLATIETVREEIEAGADRQALRHLLPGGGGARNALDCALWDLESRQTGRPVWALAGLELPRPLITTFTVGANDPAKMAQDALDYTQARSLKLKLTGDPDLEAERLRAVRQARPDAWIGVDANQGLTPDTLEALLPTLVACDVKLLEQPFAIGREADMDGLKLPLPVAADESVQGLADIEALVGRFDVVNIKLDKCGGLTEGLLMAAEARRLGLKVMVGNMAGSSLACAPGFVLGQLCDIVDLDGPIFISRDREPPVFYEDGYVSYPANGWGGGV